MENAMDTGYFIILGHASFFFWRGRGGGVGGGVLRFMDLASRLVR